MLQAVAALYSVKTEGDNKKKPETIIFYNKTKFGVDITDQMARKYTVKSCSQRWPLHIFFNILDLAAINAWVLYNETCGENISRKDFLFQLAEELSSNHNNSSELENFTNLLTNYQSSNIRKNCQIGLCNKNRTTNICGICRKYVCGVCTLKKISICKKCDIQNTA